MIDNLLSWWNFLPDLQKVVILFGIPIAIFTALVARLLGEAIIAYVRRNDSRLESPSGSNPEAESAKVERVVSIPRAPQYGFVARYDDEGHDLVARVSELLNQNRAVVLVGSGGLGKTTLAAEIVRPPSPPLAVAQFTTVTPSGKPTGEGRNVVWASADGRADFSIGTLLDEAATQLGNPDVRTLALEQKSNAVRGLLGERVGAIHESPLLVIDNFETIAAEQQKAIADFVNTLSCAVLITSRVAVEGAERVNIGAMTELEARDFLSRWIVSSKKKNALTPLIDEIANLAERNPMVMRWIVGQLERAQRMSDVLNELSRGQGDAATRVFGRSFGLLNADAQATLLSLALFVPSANRAALAFTAGFGDGIKRLNDALKPLADLQLLETDANNECLSVVGLTRRFTNAQLNKDANAAVYRKRFVNYFVSYAEAHAHDPITPEDLNTLEAERENLLAAMDIAFAAEDWQSVMRVMDVIGAIPDGLLSIHGYWDDAIVRGEQAAEAARRAGNKSAVARFEGNAAAILKDRGEYDRARDTYLQVLETLKSARHEQGVGAVLHQLGMIAQNQGDYETARARYAESLDIARKLGNQSGIALTLGQLGNLEYQQSNYAQARKNYDEILALFKKLGDQSGIARTLHQLGIIAQQQGDYDTARAHYVESLEIKKKLGDQSGIAITLHQLGRLAEIAGDKNEAERLFRESLETLERLKSPYAKLTRESLERVTQKAEGTRSEQ